MHPAWAGAGGNWPAIEEIIDPAVVKQQDKLSCGVACGEMLLRDRGINVTQVAIAAEIGVPVNCPSLARGLNLFSLESSLLWEGGPLAIIGATQSQLFNTLNTTGSWAAMFWELGVSIGHIVVVDGINNSGYVLVRDPWQGSRYKMEIYDFMLYWNEQGVFERRL